MIKTIKEILLKFQDLTTLGSANLLSTAISGIFWFFLASILGEEHYGEISYFIAIVGIASMLSFLGAGTATIVLTAKGEKVLSTIFTLTTVTSSIASVVIYIMFQDFGMSLYVIGYVVFGLAISDLLGRKLYTGYSKYLITQKLCLVVFALLFYYVIGPQGVILGYAVSFLPYFIRIYKGFIETKPALSLIKPHTGFMLNSYLLDLSRSFSGQIDKLIVAPMLGFALLGNYQLGLQFISLLGLLPGIVYQYILPHDATGTSNKKLKMYTVLVSVVFAIGGMLLTPFVFPILFPEYHESVTIIQIISIAIIPMTINLMYISKFLGMKKSKIVLTASGIYLITQISLILTMGKIFGVNGVAGAYVVATTAESVFLIIANKLFLKTNETFENSSPDNDES